MEQSNILISEGQTELPQPVKKPKNPNLYKMVLIIEIVLIAALAVANVMVNNPPKTAGGGGSQGSGSDSELDFAVCKHRTKEDIYKIVNSISKENAVSIAKSLHGKDKCVIEGLIPEKLKLKPNEYKQTILYSYDDVSEVRDIAKDSSMISSLGFKKDANDFQIDETTDYYTIVSVDNSKVDCGGLDESKSSVSCYRGIAFNKKHLDHHEKVVNNSHGDEMIFNNTSAEFVELVLKILMITDIWNANSLYDYYFEDQGDYAMLTGVYFGVGLDMDNLQGATAFDPPYAINIFEKKIKLDKKTKMATWEKFDSKYSSEQSSLLNIKSISLSNDDLIEIQAATYGLSDEEVDELKEAAKKEDEMTDAEMLESRVTAICGKDYVTIFKGSDNDGVFRCNDYTKAIYSISNPDKSDEAYKRLANATYFGTDDDETVNQFFKDKLYIYQDYRHTDIPQQLVLLLESPSEEALVENNLDAIYNYLKKVNAERNIDIIITVFYTEDLSKTHELKDYVMIAGAAGYYTWLPNGNGFGSYIYDEEEKTSLDKMGENPDLYSSQTRNAIKFRRHIQAEIKNGKQITKDALKKQLQSSFVEGAK